jgi:hypothetical protein
LAQKNGRSEGEYLVGVGTIKKRFKTGTARIKSRFKAILTDYNTENPQFSIHTLPLPLNKSFYEDG